VSISPESQAGTGAGPSVERPLSPHSALPLAFCLLVAGGIMLGGVIRQRFEHPLMDALSLLIILIAIGAAIPPWRYAIGEVLVGLAVVLLVMPTSLGLPLRASLELLAGSLLLGGTGALLMERYPPDPPDPDRDAYWRSVSLTGMLLDLLVRRRKG
jgi:hypothetical protein